MQPQQVNGGLIYYSSQPTGAQQQSYSVNYSGGSHPGAVQLGSSPSQSGNVVYYQQSSSPVSQNKSYVIDSSSDIYYPSQPQRVMGNQQSGGGQTYRIVTGSKDGSSNVIYTNDTSYASVGSPVQTSQQEVHYQPQQTQVYNISSSSGTAQIAAYPMGSSNQQRQQGQNVVMIGGGTAPQQAMRASPQPPNIGFSSQPQQAMRASPQPPSNQTQPQVIYGNSSQQQHQQHQSRNYAQMAPPSHQMGQGQGHVSAQAVGYSTQPKGNAYGGQIQTVGSGGHPQGTMYGDHPELSHQQPGGYGTQPQTKAPGGMYGGNPQAAAHPQGVVYGVGLQSGASGGHPQGVTYGGSPQSGASGGHPQGVTHGGSPQSGASGGHPQGVTYGASPQSGGSGSHPHGGGYGGPQGGGIGMKPQGGANPQMGGYGGSPQQLGGGYPNENEPVRGGQGQYAPQYSSPQQPQMGNYAQNNHTQTQPKVYSITSQGQARAPQSPLPPTPNSFNPSTRQQYHDPNKPQKRRDIPASGRNSISLDNGMAEGPPQFVAQPKGSITVMEGDPATISARVKPAGDSSLKCEWFRNGKPLCAASRFNPTFDRGYAVLEFLYTHEDDNGDYFCLAKSNSGQDQSAICHLTVHSAEGVVTDTQLPEESMVANLAAMEDYLEQNDLMRNYRPDDDKMIHSAPVMVRQPTPQLGLRENQPAHFECVVEPAGDPNLVVEWYKDGKPVSMGCRFNAMLDRGWAILDIMYCRAEDSGQYYCLVTNSKGSVQSSVVQLHCTEEGGIITQSALSKDSIAYLESLDSWNSDAMAAYDGRPAPEDQEEPSAPSFVILPKAMTAVEGTPARFLVRADGNPRPRVQWYINGDLIASSGQGGNWRIYQDGGISYLEFHRCGHPDTYQIHIVAKNQHGEATADTVLTIEAAQDYRPDLKHVLPENSFKKFMMLKHVDCTKELVDKMQKRKVDAVELRKIERISEHKGRALNTNEVEETENLYAKVQASLRSGRRSVPPQSPVTFTQPPPQPQPPAPKPTHVIMGGMPQPKPVITQEMPLSQPQQGKQPHQVLASPPQQQVQAQQQQVQVATPVPQQQVQAPQQVQMPQQVVVQPQQQVQVLQQVATPVPQQQVQAPQQVQVSQQNLTAVPQQQVQELQQVASAVPQQQVQELQQVASVVPQQQVQVPPEQLQDTQIVVQAEQVLGTGMVVQGVQQVEPQVQSQGEAAVMGSSEGMSGPAVQKAEEEYLHDETTADFTIEL